MRKFLDSSPETKWFIITCILAGGLTIFFSFWPFSLLWQSPP